MRTTDTIDQGLDGAVSRRRWRERTAVRVASALWRRWSPRNEDNGTGTAGIAEAESPQALADEVAALGAETLLGRSGALQVYCARASQIPRLLNEIGRLREITFRAAGEGTGRDRDLDRYDEYYLHLFVWHPERQEVVGAYRIGQSDSILAHRGCNGFYLQSLFRFRRPLVEQLNPALELGRSFIRPEYQRSYAPLLLLWKGIGAYVAANPRYRFLFGPVSISAGYRHESRQLLVDFLKANHLAPRLSRLVRPRRPFKRRGHSVGGVPAELDQLSCLVEQLEGDGKGVPVLLRQYLKLGGQVLAFNVDPDFADALDALVVVDLLRTERKTLARYMGQEGAAALLAEHHGGEGRHAA